MTDGDAPAARSPADRPAWQRRDVPEAGVSILQHPEWASFDEIQDDRGLVSQRFGAGSGIVFVAYGPDATPEWQLAHSGLGARTTRIIEADETLDWGGGRARRVRMRVQHAGISGHRRGATGPAALPRLDDEVVVFIGITNRRLPVLVGYRVPQSELPVFEPLLEHVLGSVRTM